LVGLKRAINTQQTHKIHSIHPEKPRGCNTRGESEKGMRVLGSCREKGRQKDGRDTAKQTD
jgi:hypothetical protein